MILGSLPYIRYVQLVNGHATPLWQDSQVRAYLRWLAYAVISVTIWRVWDTGDPLEPTFRQALFNLSSIMSSTGFFSGSFPTWGGSCWWWPLSSESSAPVQGLRRRACRSSARN